jgi:hypothetical protein
MSNFSLNKNNIIENTDFWRENTEKGYVECIQNLIQSKPFGDLKFYIFSFVKRVDDNTGVKKMYHQARLTKPHPVPGCTLLRADPRDPSVVDLMWTIPNEETFGLYSFGKMFADEQISEWVKTFIKDPESMCRPEPDDLNENQIREVYIGIAKQKQKEKACTA